MLTNVKNRPTAERVKGVVYQVKCSCGSTYVGETGRTLELHLKEHQRAVKSRQTTNRIAVHANNTHHSILWDSAEVISRETHWHKRKVQEALCIPRTDNTMNLDQGLQLNPIWSTLSLHQT